MSGPEGGHAGAQGRGGHRHLRLTGADVVRHELVQKIIEAYEKDEKRRAPQQKLDPAKFKRKK
ncbi:MAG: hypothetical protein ACLTSG_12100 [Lachnospiraceae bacterium]